MLNDDVVGGPIFAQITPMSDGVEAEAIERIAALVARGLDLEVGIIIAKVEDFGQVRRGSVLFIPAEGDDGQEFVSHIPPTAGKNEIGESIIYMVKAIIEKTGAVTDWHLNRELCGY